MLCIVITEWKKNAIKSTYNHLWAQQDPNKWLLIELIANNERAHTVQNEDKWEQHSPASNDCKCEKLCVCVRLNIMWRPTNLHMTTTTISASKTRAPVNFSDDELLLHSVNPSTTAAVVIDEKLMENYWEGLRRENKLFWVLIKKKATKLHVKRKFSRQTLSIIYEQRTYISARCRFAQVE